MTRLDAKSSLKQTIAVGNDPSGVAVGGGFVWVTNALSGYVSKIDPRANGGSGRVVDTIRVGNGPVAVVFASGRLWVANSTDRTVMEFVPGSHTPLRTLGVAGGRTRSRPVRLPLGGEQLREQRDQDRLTSGTALSPIGVGNGPTAIAVGDSAVWVANSLDGTLSRIDPTNGAVSVVPVGGSPSGIAAGPSVWASDSRAGTISRIDPASGKVAQVVRTGNEPQGVALAGTALYVAVRASGLTHRGGTLTVFPSQFGFDSIDPAVSYSTDAWSALIMTNDGLVTFQRVGGSNGARLVPDLATAIPVPGDGGRTYTFQVRTGIRYSTGAPVRP